MASCSGLPVHVDHCRHAGVSSNGLQCSAGHGSHTRSSVTDPAEAICSPGAQTVHGMHSVAAEFGWYSPWSHTPSALRAAVRAVSSLVKLGGRPGRGRHVRETATARLGYL